MKLVHTSKVFGIAIEDPQEPGMKRIVPKIRSHFGTPKYSVP